MHFTQIGFCPFTRLLDLLAEQPVAGIGKSANSAIQHAQAPDRLDTVIDGKVSPVLTIEPNALFADGQARQRGVLDQADRFGISRFIALRRANVRLKLVPQNLIGRRITEHFQKSGVAQRRGARPIQGIKPFRGGIQ